MTSAANKSRFISRGTDYLGDLASKLRDLVGYTSLAHELIQNADDSPGATNISFDFQRDGLIVDNDGVFASCDQVEENECPWKLEVSIGRMCDFHRFRRIASGDKRNQSETIGAFGIGFISVYQITDQPELMSAGQHWIVHDNRAEDKRIELCGGCGRCQASDLPGTRFFLPWAEDPASDLRKALSADIVTTQNREDLRQELEHNLLSAMLFLRNIEVISIKKDGQPSKKLTKLAHNGNVTITDGTQPEEWLLVKGTFNETARVLRQKYNDRIEEKRKADITVAILKGHLNSGLLYAYLPTQHVTGLQFHINADFYPSSDRKRVILERDYQSEWNRAAISAGAALLASRLTGLASGIGHARLWELISSCKAVSDSEPQGALSVFWQHLRPTLTNQQIVFSSEREWKTAAQSFLISDKKEETPVVSVIEKLGISIVHEDLRPHFTILRSESVGVGLLDIPQITKALRDLGLSKRVERSELPDFLQSESNFQLLVSELALLLERRRGDTRKKAELEVSGCAVARGVDGALWPPCEVFRADRATMDMFTSIAATLPFVNDSIEQENIVALSPEFNASRAIERLERLTEAELNTASVEGRLSPDKLIEWFEDRREQVLVSANLKMRLAQLPVFPTADALRPLTQLALPGDFDDPLGLADIVDVDRLGGRREFLRDLGAEELTFKSYVELHVPLALSRNSLAPEKRHQVVELIATRLGEIRDDYALRKKLASLQIVECEDGQCRLATEAYIRSQEVVSVLGEPQNFAAISGSHKEAVRDFYHWLGVATEPRTSDIASRVTEIVSTNPTSESKQLIERIVQHCGKRLQQAPGLFQIPQLQHTAWLPARRIGDRWFEPGEIFPTFNSHLFESQARFLDLSTRVQQESIDFLVEVGMKRAPSLQQVVNHLLYCVSTNTPVHKDVYRFLNDSADDTSILSLRDVPCLLVGTDFVRPDQVFWAPHPFGSFRYVLSEELRKYDALFRRLGVKEAPDHVDALAVIKEISERYGATNSLLDDGASSALLASWRMLDIALESGELPSQNLWALRELKVIPNQDHVLNPPVWMFFEDRAGLAAKFEGFLRNNAIAKPIGAWKAMAAAGVRPLSTAVETQILECSDPLADDSVWGRLKERSNQLSRVLEVQIGKEVVATAETLLNGIRCESVSDLRIRFSLKAFNQERKSQPEDVQAHYSREHGVLYFLRRDGIVPWSSIARELAVAVLHEGEPGNLALGFKEVLAADSDEALRATLDELGFASVDSTPPAPIDDGATTIGELGVGTVPPYVEPTEIAGETGQKTDGDAGPLSSDDPVGAILGPDIPPPQPLPPGLEPPPTSASPGTGTRGGASGTGKKGGASGTRKRTTSRRQGKRITYVTHNGSAEPDRTDDTDDKRSAIEDAGIRRVVESEILEERLPKIMPPNHPGYDIESQGPDGNILRYIEVKALSGVWGDRGVEVHRKQFEVAQAKGEKYWLYIVEQADTDDYRIYLIQNPAGKTDDFIFDYGWHQVADDEIEGELNGED